MSRGGRDLVFEFMKTAKVKTGTFGRMWLDLKKSSCLYIERNYYPFGMVMPGRISAPETPNRYGFQGQESDDEITGTRSHYSYEYRVQDARTGRFFSVDPLCASYPYYSQYAFSGNRLIDRIELEGLEPIDIKLTFDIFWLWFSADDDEPNTWNPVIEVANDVQTMRDAQNGRGEYAPISRENIERAKSDYISSATDIVNNVNSGLELPMVTILAIPGLDNFGDPLLALYFGCKGDYESSSAYTIGAATPFVSGIVYKGAGRTLKYVLKPLDLDWRTSIKTFREALDLAFEKAGLKQGEYDITEWAYDVNGKSVPVEFVSKTDPTRKVSIDYGHSWENGESGPDSPHIGWETGKKQTRQKGHILLDIVPSGRGVPE